MNRKDKGAGTKQPVNSLQNKVTRDIYAVGNYVLKEMKEFFISGVRKAAFDT